MKKRVISRILAGALTGIMAVGLAACGSSSSSATSSTAASGGSSSVAEASSTAASGTTAKSTGVTLEFQQWWGVELPDGALKEITDEFTKETGIGIKLLSNPYADTKTQIASGAASGTMADVVGLDGAWVYDFAKQGSIANLTKLMKDDNYDDSQLSSQVQVDGSTYMIPVVNFAYPMYVNQDILKKAGISEIPTTREEFLEDCKTITEKTDAKGWIVPLSTESPNGVQNQIMSWLWADGGSMLKDGKPNLTGNKEVADTVDYVKSLFDAGVVTDGSYSMTESDMVEEFTNGRVAFSFDSLAHATTIKKEAPNLNFTVAKVPTSEGFSGKSGMDVANWGIGVAENTKHKSEAIKFVEYMMSPEVNAKLAVLANAFPGNKNAKPDYSGQDEIFQKAYDLYQQCDAVNEFTGLPTSEDLMRTFDEQLQLYIDGDTKSVDDMLKTTQESWEQAFQ